MAAGASGRPELLSPLLRVLGFPLDPPQAVVNRVLSDLSGIARAARRAPEQLDRMLELGEEIADIGRAVLEIAERLDERAAAILVLGARFDERAEAILELGARLDGRAQAILELGARIDNRTSDLIDLGVRMHSLGDRVDARGAEVATQAGAVVEAATELIAVLPTLERALQLATPLEGAIDRFGRLVDRLPGGRRPETGAPAAPPPPAIHSGAPPTPSSGPPPVRWPRPPDS
jgi:hypothetical protein